MAQFFSFFLSSDVFNTFKLDKNYFDILVKPRDHNEIKPPIGKIFQKFKLIRY